MIPQSTTKNAGELGWSFKITMEVQGPLEGVRILIDEQKNTNRDYAEFMQKGAVIKMMELNNEYKTRPNKV